MTEKTLGSLVGALRKERGWTLKQLSTAVGMPLSTIAKVETDRLSLSYDKLLQFTGRLGLTMAEFMAHGAEQDADDIKKVTGRRSISRPENTMQLETRNYVYQYLCSDLSQKRMVPMVVRASARSLEDFGPLVRHEGEEFLVVMEGSLEVHTEFYSPVVLEVGQSIYFDSNMGHAYLAKNCEVAVALVVCSSHAADLQQSLLKAATAPVGAS